MHEEDSTKYRVNQPTVKEQSLIIAWKYISHNVTRRLKLITLCIIKATIPVWSVVLITNSDVIKLGQNQPMEDL